jgi:hypothetical protein
MPPRSEPVIEVWDYVPPPPEPEQLTLDLDGKK